LGGALGVVRAFARTVALGIVDTPKISLMFRKYGV
jgi:hypothetical protein